ncbi:MAG TPA: tRNA pseudouridine(38-40) synthase TruA [Acidobacteriota bacterium]|jgi:tRNA pseudouridine38-40 synthase
MHNYKATIQYDGTEYHGWQTQKGQPTIQEMLRRAISKITSERPVVIGSGRTDAGVHAEGQVANFKLEKRFDSLKLKRAMNAVLPDTIRILRLSPVRQDFHAQFAAQEKTYWYRIWNAPVMNPLWRRHALHVPQPLDVPAMQRGAAYLLGRHDFHAFAAAGATVESFKRRVTTSKISRRGTVVVYQISANGFLHHMVRNITGTLLLVGKGRLPASGIRQILRSGNRNLAGPTAPAHGLTLRRVRY